MAELPTSTGTTENAAVGAGAPVLDIGGDIGALVLVVADELAGTEIEISPLGLAARTHTGVHPRPLDGDIRQVALYPSLPSGDYHLWHPNDDSVLATAHIDGGRVTYLDVTHATGPKHTQPEHSTHARRHRHLH